MDVKWRREFMKEECESDATLHGQKTQPKEEG